MKNIREMLEGVLVSYLSEGMKLPTVSDFQSIKVSNDFTTLILTDPIPFKKIVE